MDCRRFREVRFLYVDGDLEETVRIEFHDHRQSCPECDRLAQLTLELLQLFRSRCCRVEAPESLRRRLRNALVAARPPENL